MTSKTAISIDTTIKARIEKVWEAWTSPDIIVQWFGSDPKGIGLSASLDVRPGGNFEVTFSDSDQTEHTCSGVYKDVEHPDKLTFSWMWRNEPGSESFVVVTLSSVGDHTRMNFEHSNLNASSKHGYLEGWYKTFGKLEAMLAVPVPLDTA